MGDYAFEARRAAARIRQRDELRARDAERAARVSEFMAERRDRKPPQLQRLPDVGNPSIELNGQNYDAGPSPYAAISPETREQYNSLIPLANRGLVDPRVPRAMLTQEIGAGFDAQKRKRKLDGDVRAIAAQARAGRISEDALKDAIGQLYQEYDPGELLSSDGFTRLTGIEDERKAAIEASKQNFAETHGYDPRFVTYDDKRNAPVVDGEAVLNEGRMLELKQMQQQPHLEQWQATAKIMAPTMPRISDFQTPVGPDTAAFEAAKSKALSDAHEYDQARRSPEAWSAYMEKKIPAPRADVENDLDAQMQGLMNPVATAPLVQAAPVDPQAQYDLVQRDPNAKEGLYLGVDGNTYEIRREK